MPTVTLLLKQLTVSLLLKQLTVPLLLNKLTSLTSTQTTDGPTST